MDLKRGGSSRSSSAVSHPSTHALLHVCQSGFCGSEFGNQRAFREACLVEVAERLSFEWRESYSDFYALYSLQQEAGHLLRCAAMYVTEIHTFL